MRSSRPNPTFFIARDAAQGLDVFLGFLLDDVGDVVEGYDADQPILGVDHRSRHQVVALEYARDLFLVLVGP